MRHLILPLLLLSGGCGDSTEDTDDKSTTSQEPSSEITDADEDGVLTDEDCDDSDNTLGAIADDEDCDAVLTADDCDDSSSFTFVGAAEIEDETLCMKDEDDDGYGDLFLNAEGISEPPEGISAGTDCDDTDEFTYPGAAYLTSETECMRDATDLDGSRQR